ncbi:MAG TPA: polymer-forming cytoskeletal protein [Kofleriaceae bacterium]|nr:polymer-forming cytoskeletal protein [Kofleriaceae bacterium]
METQLAVIPRGTRVDGLIETTGDLTVEGRADGRIQVGGTLTVAAGATCRASVRARAARVAGEVIGDLVCSSSISVAAGGRVVGDMRAPEIEVDAAAEVDGRVDLLAPAPAAAAVRRVQVTTRGPGLRRPMPPQPVTQIGEPG